MKHKGGNVYGSIYERKRKNGGISYTAEIQFQGNIIRRSLKDKELLKVWMDGVCEQLNSVLNEYSTNLELQILELRKSEYKAMPDKAKPILEDAKQYDIRQLSCANKIGLTKKAEFQTYLIRDEEIGLIKIGKSKDIYLRMKTIGKKRLKLIAYVGRDIEVYLHKLYQRARVKGEWFNLTDEEVEEIIKTFGFETPGVLFLRA